MRRLKGRLVNFPTAKILLLHGPCPKRNRCFIHLNLNGRNEPRLSSCQTGLGVSHVLPCGDAHAKFADTRGLTELDLRHTECNLNLSLHRTDDLAPSSRLPRHWSFQEISHTPDRLGEFGPSSAAVSPSERDRKSRSEVSTTWTEWSEREARARGESERREPEEGGAIEETLKV